MEDIYALAESYARTHGCPIKIVHNQTRGYYLSVSSSLKPLPDMFVQPVQNRKTVSCSTEELTSLSDCAKEAFSHALLLTNQLLQDLLQEIRGFAMDALFSLTDR